MSPTSSVLSKIERAAAYRWESSDRSGAHRSATHTIGCKSGQRRTSPLVYLRDGDRLVVLGSNFGQDHRPAWTSKLLALPDAARTRRSGGISQPVVVD
ncbi:nitroreductase/quinone reductase family protein [Nocardia sp. NPDC101769]|uniref:nitroreductase/quinone reductase family protein n=1 Tax=Nocardia sp. NPDC101769 TaxID=3364333 RepID=UPI0037F5CD5B